MNSGQLNFQPRKLPWYAWLGLPVVFVIALFFFVLLFLLMVLLLVLVFIPMALFGKKFRAQRFDGNGDPVPSGAWQRWPGQGNGSGWLGSFQWAMHPAPSASPEPQKSEKEITVTVVQPDLKVLLDNALHPHPKAPTQAIDGGAIGSCPPALTRKNR